MKIKNPPLFFLFIIFVLLNIGDTITTYYIQAAESNPLFHIFGGMKFVVVAKLIFIIIIYLIYKRNRYHSNFTYFLVISAIVMANIALGLAVYFNAGAMASPEILEQAAQIPVAERTTFYWTFMGIIYYIPMALNLIIFWIYDFSYKYVIIKREEKKYYMRRFRRWIKKVRSG